MEELLVRAGLPALLYLMHDQKHVARGHHDLLAIIGHIPVFLNAEQIVLLLKACSCAAEYCNTLPSPT